MKKRLKVNGVIMALTFIVVAASSSVFLRKTKPSFLDEISGVFGIACILLGQIFRASARGYKSEHSKQGSLLIKCGPYSLVRNPMYLGILFIGLGIVLALFQWWVACAFMLIFIIRYITLIFQEEEKLKVLFPKEFSEYESQVPRLLPRFNSLSKNGISEYLPLKLSWLKREIGSILTILLGTLLVKIWKDLGELSPELYFMQAIVIMAVMILFIFLVTYLIRHTNSQKKNAARPS